MSREEKRKIKDVYLLLSGLEREDREVIFENIGRTKSICEGLLFPDEHLDSLEIDKRLDEI